MYNSYSSTEVFGEALVGLSFGMIIFSFIISLILIISYWKIFVKAGKEGWAAIIPIYNTIKMLEIAELPLWYIVLFLIPIANVFAIFKMNIEIAKKFGKSTGFGIGMALFGVIFIPLLAFSDTIYKEKSDSNNSNNGVEIQNTFVNAPIVDVPTESQIVNAPIMEGPTESQVVNAPIMDAPTEGKVASAPIMDVPTESQVASAPIMDSNEVNAFNSKPIIDNADYPNNNSNIQEINEDSIIQNLAQTAAINKKCKNCGNELPDIVSICPNCGTDNE